MPGAGARLDRAAHPLSCLGSHFHLLTSRTMTHSFERRLADLEAENAGSAGENEERRAPIVPPAEVEAGSGKKSGG
jgi:hypothetical protein